MPSIYNFRHVELDKVGRGKRAAKAGESHIFGEKKNLNGGSGSGSCSETESVDGSVFSCPSTPVHNANNLFFGYDSDSCSNPSSASSSRRGSLQETKNRLFGQEEEIGSPRRHLVNRMKSNIFQEPEPAQPAATRVSNAKKYEHVVNRNPITGEVQNGTAVVMSVNGVAVCNNNRVGPAIASPAACNVNGSNGSQSLPCTPTRTRQPPGGKSSNIFRLIDIHK